MKRKNAIAARARQMMGSDRLLFRKYRGQNVAYIDLWKKTTKTKSGVRLVRKILGHGDLVSFEEIWASVPARLRSRVVFRFIEDLPPNTIRM